MCLKLLFTHLEVQVQNTRQAPLIGGWSLGHEQEAEQSKHILRDISEATQIQYCGIYRMHEVQIQMRTLERSQMIHIEW